MSLKNLRMLRFVDNLLENKNYSFIKVKKLFGGIFILKIMFV